MVKLVLITDPASTFQLSADGTIGEPSESAQPEFSLSVLHLEARNKSAKLSIETAVGIPVKLLVQEGEHYRIATRSELGNLANDEWAALRARARQALAQPIRLAVSATGQDFFGLRTSGGAALAASVLFPPALLDGLAAFDADDPILQLDAVGTLAFSHALENYQALKLEGRLALKVVVYRRALDDIARALMATLDVDVPRFPGFDLGLPAIPMPDWRFPKVGIEMPDGWFPSLFDAALPAFGGGVRFVLAEPKPKFAIAVADGQLTITTTQTGSGEFQYDAGGAYTKLLDVSELAVELHNGQLDFKAKVIPAPATYTRQNIKVDKEWLPFTVEVAELEVTTSFSPIDAAAPKPPGLTIAYKFRAIRIASRNEPDLFITLDLKVTTTAVDGGIGTTVNHLEVVAPYPLKLIQETLGHLATAVGKLIRLIGPIPLPAPGAPDSAALMRLLAHLGRMLGAGIMWLAQQAGAAAALLAGLLESVAKALGKVLEALARAGAQAFSHVIIELRLDPKTYQLRQVVVQPAGWKTLDADVDMSSAGFDFRVAAKLEPSLVLDLGPEQWFGLVVRPQPDGAVTLGTDLWLSKETGPSQPVGLIQDAQPAPTRLIVLTARPGTAAAPSGQAQDIVVVAVQRGRLRLFQKLVSSVPRARPSDLKLDIAPNLSVSALCQSGRLADASIGTAESDDLVIEYKADTAQLKARVLALMPKADTSASAPSGGGASVLNELKQKIEIVEIPPPTIDTTQRQLRIAIKVRIHLEKTFAPETALVISVDLADLSMKLSGGDRIAIKGIGSKTYSPFGMELLVGPKEHGSQDEYEQFYLDLAHGGESMGLGPEAVAELSYGSVSSSGKGLQFKVPTFRVGRGGIDLEAHIKPDPVILGGVDVPFKFDSGQIAITGSRFTGGSLTGSGQLPQSLIGEANASVALTLAGRNGEVVVEAATARINKSGDPIRCKATRFDLTITELGFDFVREGGYHFFFQLTGSATFNPGKGEFTSGLLKHFCGVEIKLDKAPLAADPRVLMRAMSFKVKVDPVKTIKAFDIFSFELRSFGYHPASPAFDGDPAISIGGQVKFLEGGDKLSTRIDFHDLWCSYGEGKPRFRFDGLAVGLAFGGVKVEGTAISVDGNLPSLYRPEVLPANVTAHGFLAAGKIEFPGWSPMTAAMGFLELRKKGDRAGAPRHAFFIYGQLDKQTDPIDTPVGRIYLREYGFGFGYRYTLAGIAQAETARSPNELVKILDEVSKYQGSLDRFEAWEPTYDNADLTFALRGMFSMGAASERGSYNADKEKDIPNPLLLDIVAALRTDLTFLINVRAWVAVNYDDWARSAPGDAWRTNPTMRGYLYFSVPRKEFLGRFVANKAGHIGVHPPLPAPLVEAIRGTDFSATLYIRPGLFHFELGWPFELGVALGKPGDAFHMKIRGGLIHRMEDFSVLFGMAFRAEGAVHLAGGFGSGSFGAAAVAHADFAIEAKILAFLSLRSPGESMYYGELRIDVTVRVSVEVWLSFSVFGRRVKLSTGFSLDLAVSIALEAVLSARSGLGGRACASVGMRAFGRSASIGIGFSFNNGLLQEARARVARYSAMGLAAPVPDRSEDGSRVETSPPPQPPRSEVAAVGDEAVDSDLGNAPVDTTDEATAVYQGRAIGATDFWAMLFPTAAPDGKSGDWYVMQLVPRDHTPVGTASVEQKWGHAKSTFYASPRPGDGGVFHSVSPLEGDALAAGAQIFAAGEYGAPVDGSPQAPWGKRFAVRLANEVQAADPVEKTDPVTIEILLASLFLEKDDTQEQRPYGEPRPRAIDAALGTLQRDTGASARQLARSGRSRANLDGLARREARIEESRSAVLAAVVDSAERLALQGIAGGTWPQRHAEIDARDFGLTFVLNQAAIDALFVRAEGDEDDAVPRRARFKIGKSDFEGTAEGQGEVLLFNPPERMFRSAQPTFTPTHTVEAQGIKLDWDLEPAWGNSQGAYHDPEFHLKHYRVVRTIDGLSEQYRAEFIVKAAAPITIMRDDGDNKIRTIFMRPPFQFVDDLRKQGSERNEREEDLQAGLAAQLPESLRKVLLGRGTQKEWDDAANGVKVEDVRISYEIVAVDIAGTSDVGRPYLVTGFTAAPARPLSPREASLQLTYQRLPRFPEGAMPVLRLLARPALMPDKSEPEWPKRNDVFQLRILSEPARAVGSYGTDAIDAAGRRLDERAIDSLRGDDVSDFLLVVKPYPNDKDKAKSDLVSEWLPEGGRARDTKLVHHALDVRRVKGTKLEPASMEAIAKVLGVGMLPADIGKSHRMFLRKIDLPSTENGIVLPPGYLQEKRHGEWRTVNANIVITDADTTRVSAVVEEFEQPTAIAFRALSRNDLVEGASGRLHLIQPAPNATLQTLLDAASDEHIAALSTVRDPARRTAARLTWKARPDALHPAEVAGAGGAIPELHRWVGGFDLHVVDADGVPPGADLATVARPVGRISLLPRSLAQLDPPGFGDFGSIESAYPSDTLRLHKAPAGAGASGIRKAAWYSAAESTALFPRPAIRRSLLPDPDEDQLAALFAGGAPAAIRISIPRWYPDGTSEGEDPLPHWRLVRVDDGIGRLHPIETPMTDPAADKAARVVSFGFPPKAPDAVRITVALARDLLQSVCLMPDAEHLGAAYASEKEALEQRLATPAWLAAVKVRVEALHGDLSAEHPVLKVTSVQECLVDLAPPLHPVLADTLALLAYAPLPGVPDGTVGQVFRRYSLVSDMVPDTTARSFNDWLADAPPERDPHGWGALRVLGLASGFRLYDSEQGDYLTGPALLKQVNKCFASALDRYRDNDPASGRDRRHNGQPFVDILTRPWGNAQLYWFDGGYRDPDLAERNRMLANDTLAVVQIALRPAPDRMAVMQDEAAAAPLVHYFVMRLAESVVTEDDAPAPIADWTVELRPRQNAPAFRFDVLPTVESLVAQRPVRLSGTSAARLRALPVKCTRIAVIRAVRVGRAEGNPLELALGSLILRHFAPGATTGTETLYRLKELGLALQEAGLDAPRAIDPAFGKFTDLSGEDWSDALFRPAPDGVGPEYTVAVAPAFEWQRFYAQRRFGPLVVARGKSQLIDGIQVEDPVATQARAELAGSLARFWLRYLEHCAAHPAASMPISFSLGTLADPGHWRCAPDAQGNVSVLIPETSRRGARRKYAVRPFGRYESWVKASGAAGNRNVEQAPSLEGALLPDAAREQFFDITLPRTEPLEKPVILSALRQADASAGSSGRLELVIAHSLDMVLGQANQRNDAQLAPLDISVGYWRQFPHPDWLHALAVLASEYGSTQIFNALAPFGSIDMFPAAPLPKLDKDSAASRLRALRQRVPDAWMGATMVTAVPPPYFFRVHALVHSSAGIVLSEETGATFEEGASTLRFDHLEAGYGPAQRAAAPFYEVARVGPNEDPLLLLNLPALRFIDCMHLPEAAMWFGPNGEYWEGIRPVAHLPEPGVSYRIAIETAIASGDDDAPMYEPLARQAEVDLLPAPTARPTPGEADRAPEHRGLYLARGSGSRLHPWSKGATNGALRLDPVPADADALEWRICVALLIDPLALPRPLTVSLPAQWSDAMANALARLPVPKALPRAIDGLRAVTLTKGFIIDGWGEAWKQVMALLHAPDHPEVELAPEALGALLAWERQPDEGAMLELAVPEHLLEAATPALAALSGNPPLVNGAIGTVVLRRAPSDEELRLVRQESPELGACMYKLATKQLFDDGRRLVVSAMKGPLRPITSDIGRKSLS